MPTSHYIAHGLEALQVIEHTLHHLDLDHLDADEEHDFARFERNREWFENTFRRDREKADEAWDLMIGPLLSVIEAAGDGSDELEQHRDDLIALSEDYLGTHHNRDGFTGIDDREDNPSKAIINRRRAILWAIIRNALEHAPPGINHAVVSAALGPIVDHLANPPKAAKAAKVKPTKPLKEGQLGDVMEVQVLAPIGNFNGRTQFEELTGSKWQEHEGIASLIVPARLLGFIDSKRQLVVVDLRELPEASRKGLFHPLHAFDLVSGIPLNQEDTPKELIKRLRFTWNGGASPIDHDQLLASVGTVADIIARDWETTAALYRANAFDQRSEKGDRKLLEAFVELQRLQQRRGLSTALPAVHADTDLETAFRFLIEYSHQLATSQQGWTDEDLAANQAFHKAANLYSEAGASKFIKHHDFFTQTMFDDKLREAVERVEDWGDQVPDFSDAKPFDAWQAERDAEKAARERQRAEDLARREAYAAAEAARLAKPEEAAFDRLFNSDAYHPWKRSLYQNAYKVLGGDPKTSGSTNWFEKFRNAEFNIGASRNDTPFVLGKFIEAARQLRALGAEVTNAPEPKPNAYRMVKFNLPGQFDKQGKPVTGTVKAKPNETMFYLFDYLRLWNEMDPPAPAPEPEEVAPPENPYATWTLSNLVSKIVSLGQRIEGERRNVDDLFWPTHGTLGSLVTMAEARIRPEDRAGPFQAAIDELKQRFAESPDLAEIGQRQATGMTERVPIFNANDREDNPASSVPALILGAAFGAGAYALTRRLRQS